jgi:hypothetical protein
VGRTEDRLPLFRLQVVPYSPVVCKGCNAALNPFCNTDFQAKIWICPFCHNRNHFPSHYSGVSEDNMPAELFSQYSTIEYTLDMQPALAPAYIFVMDTAVSEDELVACRTALTRTLQNIPEYAQVRMSSRLADRNPRKYRLPDVSEVSWATSAVCRACDPSSLSCVLP